MKENTSDMGIDNIPVEEIMIVNPRARNQRVFKDIVENISRVGLKRPITVTHSNSEKSSSKYDLVCGQGRLEAFIALGQTHIPAIVIDESEERVLLKSLIENCARRQHRPLEHLLAIKALHKKGYDAKTISEKIGLAIPYAKIMLDLLTQGEERLLAAVEAGTMPVRVAALIANSPDNEQRVLQEAYENNELRGEKLKRAQQLLEIRKEYGKGLRKTQRKRSDRGQDKPLSTQELVKVYQKEVDRKKVLIRKADVLNRQMLFIVESLRGLCAEDKFTALLEAENLISMPKQLAMAIGAGQ
jgi:ParB family chromosome partitioning protein